MIDKLIVSKIAKKLIKLSHAQGAKVHKLVLTLQSNMAQIEKENNILVTKATDYKKISLTQEKYVLRKLGISWSKAYLEQRGIIIYL